MMRRILLATAFALGAAEPVTPVSAREPLPAVAVELVAEGFNAPLFLVAPPDGSGRRFLGEQMGVIYILGTDGKPLEAPFIDLRDQIVPLRKAFDERVIFDGLDLLIRRGERWCVMGANGAGKTTLLKLAVEGVAPDAGSVTLGAGVKLGYFAQHSMELLDGDQSVWQTLERAFPQAPFGALRALAASFGFPGDEVEKRCSLLSGGEKARLVMARMLFDPPNLLVLDEPTNHLDLGTKEMLIGALAAYEGTLLLVSHDRHFLSHLTSHVLELGPEGPKLYPGSYSEYVIASGHEAPGMRAG